MNNFFLVGFIVLLQLACLALNAQTLAGSIIYDYKVDVHVNLPPEMEDMKVRIPQFQTLKKELFFRSDYSLYKDYEDDSQSRSGMMFRIISGSSTVRLDLQEMTYAERKTAFGEEFLIEGDSPFYPWKIAPETKEIAGYTCQRAWYIKQDSTEKYVEAWFSPEIPLGIGPDLHFGLPGAILELDIQYGEINYIATNISLTSPKDSELRLPKGGRKVTKEEYDEFVKAKTKEMEASGGLNTRRSRRN
jgi:GLPGLI family protein